MNSTRIDRQLEFIREIDKVKEVCRQTRLRSGSRRENDAEHSWHVAVMALVLAEHAAPASVDVARVIRMVLVHDLVEIDAGDTFCYDEQAVKHQRDREGRAADRIFALLPPDQAADLRAVWDEFEDRSTPEARFAHALDRLQPLLQNCLTQGGSWREHGVSEEQVRARCRAIDEGSSVLGSVAANLVGHAVRQGWLRPA